MTGAEMHAGHAAAADTFKADAIAGQDETAQEFADAGPAEVEPVDTESDADLVDAERTDIEPSEGGFAEALEPGQLLSDEEDEAGGTDEASEADSPVQVEDPDDDNPSSDDPSSDDPDGDDANGDDANGDDEADTNIVTVVDVDAVDVDAANIDVIGGPDESADESSPDESSPDEAEPALPTPVSAPSGSSFDDTPLARELSEITRRRRALAAEELPLPPRTRVFTVANQKGGVGKTTTTVNLAAALARNGARVLVIDLDPQGNSSTALGIEHRSETVSVYDVIINDVAMDEVVQKSPEFEALYCIPATIHLAGAEIELVSLVAREQRLRTALDHFLEESEEPFHYVFIDCPPSLGLLTINAFVAASEVLIPIQCEYYALEGLSQLLTNIQLIERHLNPHLSVSTILLTMYDSRTNLANQVAQDVRDHFPDQVLSTLIPRSVRISEAPSYGQSVISYDSNSPGSLSYLEAAAEIARRGAPN